MSEHSLITSLLDTKDKRKQKAILKKNLSLLDLSFAEQIKDTYYDSWTTEPQKTRNAASSLAIMSEMFPQQEEIRGLAHWVQGIAFLTDGKIEKACHELDAAAQIFNSLNQSLRAAQTQISKLYALALLGRYDEAVKTGKAALKVLQRHQETLPAAKIEMNLGNIALRRGYYREAEKYFLAARAKFLVLNEKSWLTMCENDLAITYSGLNDFRRAEEFYAQALAHAAAEKMHVTEAEIEASMGNLATFRGRLNEALRYLELSRQKYLELKMPHQTAIAELEIADIYLELNLTDEALEIYQKTVKSLRKLKLQGEEARARANFGKAALIKGDFRKARQELEKSAELYVLEKNLNGAVSVRIAEASLELSRRDYEKALKIILETEKLIARTENPRLKLLAQWLRGEIAGNLGQTKKAEKILSTTFREATKREQPNLAQICLNSLGNLALRKNDLPAAESCFKRAIGMIEKLRAPLAAEEFRMSFLADKLAPFENLTKIYLSKKDLKRAFSFVEKARARTLSETLSGVFSPSEIAGDDKLSRKLSDLREELNWFYSRQKYAAAEEFEKLQKEARKREKQIAEVMRQIESTRVSLAENPVESRTAGESAELRILQRSLGASKALVEFVSFEGVLSAFVITDRTIEFAAEFSDENEVLTLLESLHFQFDTMRYGGNNLASFSDQLKKRADFYLQKLYDKLIQPLEKLIENRDLIIVPVGATHYVPFQALCVENAKYLIETREIVYAPSAAVWRYLNDKPPRTMKKALLFGYADEKIPSVYREIESLKRIFAKAQALTKEDANFSNYEKNAPLYDILHLACHGQFRPENPMFSSLHLADGYITVRDICAQKLNASLVTLSACETGLNKIYAGDEIIGLARGFLSSGADSLCLSLWTVSDEATAKLMSSFYINLQRGASVAASLRQAQINFINKGVHPYFWSPFAVIGK